MHVNVICHGKVLNLMITPLNSAMWLMSGVVQSTSISLLLIISNIIPPEIRWNKALVRIFIKIDSYKNSIIYRQLENTPKIKSRKLPWIKARELTQSQFSSMKKIAGGVVRQYGAK